jgi:hypothetical protein
MKTFQDYLEASSKNLAVGNSAVSQLADKFKPSERDHDYYIKQCISNLKLAKQKIPVKHSIHGGQREKKIDDIIEVLNGWASK